jgi:hypothetical protein
MSKSDVRLAGAVRAEEAEDLALGDVDADTDHRLHRTALGREALAQAGRGDGGGRWP